MKKLLLLLVCVNVFLFSCQEKASSPKSELLEIIKKLRTDEDHEFLMTLRPTDSDLYEIFRDSMYTERAIEYSNKVWNGIDKIPANALGPVNEDDIPVAVSATQDQLLEWSQTDLSMDYIMLCEFLKADVVIYGMQYVDKKGMGTKSRGAFFRVDEKWIFVPQLFRAFL